MTNAQTESADVEDEGAENFALIVASNIEKEMNFQGINALELARRAKLNQTAIYDILKAKIKNPRIDTVFKIAAGLGVPPSSLMEDNRAEAVREAIIAAIDNLSLDDQERLLTVARIWGQPSAKE